MTDKVKNAIGESAQRASKIIENTVDAVLQHVDDTLIARIIVAREAAQLATQNEEVDRLLAEFKSIVMEEAQKAGGVFSKVVAEAAFEALREIIKEKKQIGNI